MDIKQNLSEPDQKVVEMVQNAVTDAKSGSGYYGALMEKIKNREDREIVRQIMLDGIKHEKMLGQIYKKISGQESNALAEKREPTGSIQEEFKANIFSSMAEGEYARVLFATFLNLEIRDMMQEIIMDKQNHATKFSYLYAKYN